MRWVLRILIALAVIFLIGWVAAEALLVYGAKQLEKNGDFTLGRASMMIDPARIGATYGDITLEQNGGQGITISDLGLWVRPWRLNEFNVSLPSHLTAQGLPFSLGLTDGKARARFAPLHGFNLVSAGISADRIELDDQMVGGPLNMTARMTNFGSAIPVNNSFAYRVDSLVSDIRLSTLSGLFAPREGMPTQNVIGRIQGRTLVWLQRETQSITGVFPKDLTLSVGDNDLLIRGYVMQDTAGDMQGKIALDFTNPREFMVSLREAGVFPANYAHLVASMLENLATDSEGMESQEPRSATSANLQEQLAFDRFHSLPAKPAESRRIILTVTDNEFYTGTVPVSALLRRLENASSAPF